MILRTIERPINGWYYFRYPCLAGHLCQAIMQFDGYVASRDGQ